MHRDKTDLLETLQQEIQLPEINADACVHTLFEQADCQACVASCPTQAWILDDNALGLDTEACDGCGLCVPACPTGALHVQFPWVIRTLAGRKVALFACEKSEVDEDSSLIPCIHSLGLRQLLLLHNSGIEHLLITTANCYDCVHHQATGIHQRLEQINSMLNERKKPAMKIMQRSNKVWDKVFLTNEVLNQGTQLSRRNFLSGGGQILRHQMVLQDPLNLPEHRTIPPGKLLPDTEVDYTELHWPWTAQLDEKLCNGCDACIKLCPTDALEVIKSDGDTLTRYQLNPASCTGCSVCATVCEPKAISIHSKALCEQSSIELLEKRCTACGTTFHLPQQNSLAEELLCRICQIHNHSKNLFQVLD